MENDAIPGERGIFGRRMGLAAIYSQIADPGQHTLYYFQRIRYSEGLMPSI